MSTAVARMMRVPITAEEALVRDIQRASEIRLAAIARANADFGERVKDAYEKHFAPVVEPASAEAPAAPTNGSGVGHAE